MDVILINTNRRLFASSRFDYSRRRSASSISPTACRFRLTGRAWAGGEINKSLLTLGRVINAIFEHSGHIPWVLIQSARIKLKMVAANSTA
ncbi:hypothetical protein ACLB2K_036092 [Fragaria x ananassa]